MEKDASLRPAFSSRQPSLYNPAVLPHCICELLARANMMLLVLSLTHFTGWNQGLRPRRGLHNALPRMVAGRLSNEMDTSRYLCHDM